MVRDERVAERELRPEPPLLERVARETTVAVPTVSETVDDGGELGAFYYLLVQRCRWAAVAVD